MIKLTSLYIVYTNINTINGLVEVIVENIVMYLVKGIIDCGIKGI